MIDEMRALQTLTPTTTDLSDLDVDRWRAVLLDRISRPAPKQRRRSRQSRAAIGAVGLVVVLGGAAAAASILRNEDANPGEPTALSLDHNGAALVVEPSSDGQVCIATRADRGRGSVCTPRNAADVMIGYTVSTASYAVGVFDPQQRATLVVADEVRVLPSKLTSESGTLIYFSLAGVRPPKDVRVLDQAGTEIARFTPPTDTNETTKPLDEESAP